MDKIEVLNKLQEKKISKNKAYKLIYPKVRKRKKAHFVKIKVKTYESKKVSVFLSLLFFLPIPIFTLKFALKFIKNFDEIGFSIKELKELISIKGIIINIHSKNEAKISIKTF